MTRTTLLLGVAVYRESAKDCTVPSIACENTLFLDLVLCHETGKGLKAQRQPGVDSARLAQLRGFPGTPRGLHAHTRVVVLAQGARG